MSQEAVRDQGNQVESNALQIMLGTYEAAGAAVLSIAIGPELIADGAIVEAVACYVAGASLLADGIRRVLKAV